MEDEIKQLWEMIEYLKERIATERIARINSDIRICKDQELKKMFEEFKTDQNFEQLTLDL